MAYRDNDVRIEYPSAGATYSAPEFGVYAYDEYPPSSVLAGQERRRFLASFATEAEAVDFCRAEGLTPSRDCSCGFRPPCLSHLPGPDDLG